MYLLYHAVVLYWVERMKLCTYTACEIVYASKAHHIVRIFRWHKGTYPLLLLVVRYWYVYLLNIWTQTTVSHRQRLTNRFCTMHRHKRQRLIKNESEPIIWVLSIPQYSLYFDDRVAHTFSMWYSCFNFFLFGYI